MTNKYGNRKVNVNGIEFDSRKEGYRYAELCLMERAGAIQNLRRQVKFELLPSQYAEYRVKGANGKIKAVKRLLERECSYVADFVYEENGKTVVEDTKGFRTKDYIIKRKLMLYKYDIRIREV
jgi:hypothetical protein